MFSQERQERITGELTRNGRVEVLELAQRYGVSEHTIRRDLRALSERGLLQKTHGGAVSLNTAQLNWATRSQVLPATKADIGARAATLVQPGDTVIIEAGSTTLSLAQQLAVRPLTVITNALDVAQLFEADAEVNLIVSGGQWNAQARAFYGLQAQNVMESYRADWTFLGACALHLQTGVTVTSEPDAVIKRAMASAGLRVVVLADHSKRDQVAAHLVLPLDRLDIVVTDSSWPELEATGVSVLYPHDSSESS